MPSMTTHSPYETLAFFQSIARYGAHPTALQDISTILKQNEHIREHATFDGNRLSADILRQLYDDYVQAENNKQSPRINGQVEAGERSPKRRKLSPTPQSFQDDKVRDLVDRLYEKYKAEIVHEIKRDEEAYVNLQSEIQRLEQQIADDAKIVPQTPVPPSNVARDQSQPSQTDNRTNSQPATKLTSQDAETLPSTTVTKSTSVESKSPLPPENDKPVSRQDSNPQSVPSQPLILAPTPQQPSTVHRQQSSPSQRPAYTPVQPHNGPSHMTHPQQRPTPRGQQNNQGRGSPLPYQGQHPYPPYPQYPPPPPQWHPHMSTQQYPQHAAYGPPQYYPPPQTGRHPQTPQQIPYMPYPHTAPIQYIQQQQRRGQQWPTHPASATSTPISRSDGRTIVTEPRSSTPWRRKQQVGQPRSKSPPHPETETIPNSDRETWSTTFDTIRKRVDRTKKLEEETPTLTKRRRGRPPSVTPSILGQSRSQSIASRTSDMAQNEKLKQNHKTKVEPPSTPLPHSDTEQPQQRSTGQRGRPRNSTINSQVDGGAKTMTTKRKRDSTSPNSSLFTTPPSRRATQQPHDPSLVVVSRNFSKTSQLLLNEITSHKLAGIFAKPLSERDAPGYKDLVLRPQDLKSIKAAVSKGGRAALATIESIEGDGEPTPTIKTQLSNNIGPIGNGFYLVPKTADLLPPKGIVNSSQLEMELVRMFANAVMFNPLPSFERGFGRYLRLRKHGGDLDVDIEVDQASTSEESESGSSSGFEEGGIISDAREMFKDVVSVVGKWRELEGERMGVGTDVTASRHGSFATPALPPTNDGGRQTSVSASSNLGEEENTVGESESISTPVPQATSRKRRRMAFEH